MTKIDYYFDKTVSEIIEAVKGGIIPYDDLVLLLEFEESNKNRITLIKAIKRQMGKLNENNRDSTRYELKIKRLETLVKAQEKGLDVADRIVDVVVGAMGNIPIIKKPKTYNKKKERNEEVALLLLSDLHIGKKTPTYNSSVFKERMVNLRKSMMSVVTGMRSIRPVNKLVIVMNGDIIDAESIYPSQSIDGIDAFIISQIFSTGLPALTEFVLYCAENFDKVDIHCVRGNHGKLNASKWSSSKTTNWDTVIYKALEALTVNQKNIKWNVVVNDWKNYFKIFNYGFFHTHGDMIKSYYNIPMYGMTRQSQRWANAFRDKIRLDYFLFSHFHSLNTGQRWNDLEIFVNGAFVTDDQFALEKMGVCSKAEQLIIGVHPKHGVTWRFRLNLF